MKILPVLFLSLFLFIPSVSALPIIEFTTDSTTHNIGDIFNITITLDPDGQEIHAWLFEQINFSTLFSATSLIGPYWRQDAPGSINFHDNGTVHNDTGTITYPQAGFGYEFTITLNQTILLNITLTALQSGTYTITSDSSELFAGQDVHNVDHTLIPIQITVLPQGDDDDPPPPPPPPPPDDDDEPVDSDGDGVPDDEDICPGHDDNIDSDNDTIPDGCDDTPFGDPEPPEDNETTNETTDLVAHITFIDKNYTVGQQIDFLAEDSIGTITFYNWEFGDGVGIENLVQVQHSYENPGNYTVTLTVARGSNTSQARVTVTVNPKPYVPPPPVKPSDDLTIGVVILIASVVVFGFFYIRLKKQGLI